MDTDDWLKELGSEIRARSDDDPGARQRIMTAIEGDRGPGRRQLAGREGVWSWLLRPRPIPVSPLGWVVAAALVIGLSLGWLRGFGVSPPVNIEMAEKTSSGEPGPRRPGPGTWPTQFVVLAPTATHVSIVGDFNDWEPEGTPLKRSGQGGMWTATLLLPAGVYSYNYVVDGQLQHAADEPGLEKDEFGGGHSIIVVGEESI